MQDKNLYLMVIINNAIALICWVVLAIIFNKWGLALFALLFMKSVGGYRRICDGCGAKSPCADSPENAIKRAAKFGWVTIARGDGEELDYCPKCQKNGYATKMSYDDVIAELKERWRNERN